MLSKTHQIREEAVSRYMAWAKLRSTARFNLAVSGVVDFPISDLPVMMQGLEIGGTGPYGYGPLMERLAAKAGVPEDCVVYTFGASMANFLALSALVHAGDEVLVERPTYDPLLAILDHLGARVSRFERRADHGFRIGLGEFERRITPDTRLVVLCNLHNPSSVLTDEDTLREVGIMAAKVGARVLVDEVYVEAMFDRRWRSAFHLGPNFVVTSSLTKAYGLSGIRCGWVLAEPELVRRMWQIVDFTYGSPVHPAERMAVVALDHLDLIRDRARNLLDANRALANNFLRLHPDVICDSNQYGTTIFPSLRKGSAEKFVTLLRDQFETSVVPGDFFEQPQHFRVGICGSTETVRGGLERMDAALEVFRRSVP